MAKTLNLNQFNKRIKESVENSKITFKDFQGRFFQELAQRILKATPVDTARARSNWMMTMDSPSAETTDKLVGVSSRAAPLTTEEWQKIRSIRTQLRESPMGRRVWIVNNLPYIQRLENGWSRQAPQGMVRVSSVSALEVVRRRIKRSL